MSNKPCPFCGAKSTKGGWGCGSARGGGGLVFHRGNECHIRELRASRDALVDEARRTDGLRKDLKKDLDALRDEVAGLRRQMNVILILVGVDDV